LGPGQWAEERGHRLEVGPGRLVESAGPVLVSLQTRELLLPASLPQGKRRKREKTGKKREESWHFSSLPTKLPAKHGPGD
jgi:hypothetical protein